MKKLSLSCARSRFRNGEQQFNRPSRFIQEIPRYLIHSAKKSVPSPTASRRGGAGFSAAEYIREQNALFEKTPPRQKQYGSGTWNPASEMRSKQAARPSGSTRGKSGLDLLAGNPMISKGFGTTYQSKKTEPSPVTVSYTQGDRVSHARFGEGVITLLTPSGSDYEVTVAFDNGNTRKMLASFAKLKKL
jgi:DNA helicase-2/ATP-dependent DNA helicase PcrA